MLDAHSGMRFPQLIDAGFKDCSKLPAEKERPQVPAVELRWNRDCLVPERAIVVRISPQII